MAKRSLQASPLGATKAKQQFASKGWTQEYLASEIGIKTRQTRQVPSMGTTERPLSNSIPENAFK